MTAKIMPATKEAPCMKCLCLIHEGEMIAYAREFGAMHVSCPVDGIVEEFAGYINMSPGKDTDDDWCIRVINPDGAEGLEGQEVEILTSKGNLKTETLGELVQLYEPRHAVYRKTKWPTNNDPVTEVGVYETPDGDIYQVKSFTPNGEDKEVLYARKMVEIGTERLNENEVRVKIEFVKERGAVYRLKASWKMSYERAKELTLKYRRCMVCGRRLKAADSVEQGIGPVCIKTFSGQQLSRSLKAKPVNPDQMVIEETTDIEMPVPALTEAQIKAMSLDEVRAMLAKLQGGQS